MKVIYTLNGKYYLKVVPRYYYLENLEVTIREPLTNEITVFETNATYENGLIAISLSDFNPFEDTRYSITVKKTFHYEEFIVWTGQALFTYKDRQNYSLNNSDENSLRF